MNNLSQFLSQLNVTCELLFFISRYSKNYHQLKLEFSSNTEVYISSFCIYIPNVLVSIIIPSHADNKLWRLFFSSCFNLPVPCGTPSLQEQRKEINEVKSRLKLNRNALPLSTV